MHGRIALKSENIPPSFPIRSPWYLAQSVSLFIFKIQIPLSTSKNLLSDNLQGMIESVVLRDAAMFIHVCGREICDETDTTKFDSRAVPRGLCFRLSRSDGGRRIRVGSHQLWSE